MCVIKKLNQVKLFDKMITVYLSVNRSIVLLNKLLNKLLIKISYLYSRS